jgi:hypothetical protein
MSQKDFSSNMNPPNILGEPSVQDEDMNLHEESVQDEESSLSSISTFGKNNDNELLFAPTCTTCFNENKYLSMSEKKCAHAWKNVCLNSTGEYIVFLSDMMHRGYCNGKSNRIVTMAQLFCAPTEYTNVLQLPQSILKGEDFTEWRLDKSTLLPLRDNLISNWDINYSNANFRPCKNFSGGAVNRTSNRQIQKKKLSQVPLLKNLVDTFETMFPYLSVDLVWLLCKSKEGDGFQGWHKDFLLGQQIITKTIVINLGSKEKEDEETTRSFNNGVSFEVDDWNDIKDYALSEINLENDLSQDESKPAAIPNKNPLAKP